MKTLIRRSAAPAMRAVIRRKRGSILTSLGVAMGVFALVAMFALSTTVQAQVSSRFTALLATKVTIQGLPEQAAIPAEASSKPSGQREYLAEGINRVGRLNGVKSAGMVAFSDKAQPVKLAAGLAPVGDVKLAVANPGAVEAHRLVMKWGAPFDEGNAKRGSHVALVGTVAARQLGLEQNQAPVTLLIAGERFVVAGVYSSPDPGDGMDDAVVLPPASMVGTGVAMSSPSIVVATQPGYARQVAGEAVAALDPYARFSLQADVPPDPQSLREQVSGDTQAMVYAFGVVALIIGALSISNTMLVSVFQRRHELGVRSALGATAGDIVGQIVTEGLMIGLVGGLLGALVGCNAVLALALYQNWLAVIPLWLIPVGLVLGGVVGAIASVYPAFRAARIDPVEALIG